MAQAYLEQPFRFFDLPRELRNKIYSYLTVEIGFRQQVNTARGVQSRGTGFHLDNIPSPTLLLTNRKLATEYSEELAGKRELVIEDIESYGLHEDGNTLPAVFEKDLTRCTIFYGHNCREHDPNHRVRWLSDWVLDWESCRLGDAFLSALPSSIESLHIILGVRGPGYFCKKTTDKEVPPSADQYGPFLDCIRGITDMPKIQELSTRRLTDRRDACVVWTRQRGWNSERWREWHQSKADGKIESRMINVGQPWLNLATRSCLQLSLGKVDEVLFFHARIAITALRGLFTVWVQGLVEELRLTRMLPPVLRSGVLPLPNSTPRSAWQSLFSGMTNGSLELYVSLRVRKYVSWTAFVSSR